MKIHFVMGRKGGIGKSTFTYNLANIAHRDGLNVLFVDMDDDTNTSERQLKFVEFKKMHLLDEKTEQIDRQLLDFFFEEALDSDYDSAICDLGATASQQFLVYLKDKICKETMKEYMDEGLEFCFHIILAGQDMYPSCADYAEEVLQSTRDLGKRYIVKNNYFTIDEEQNNDLKTLAKTQSCKIREFDVINGHGTTMISDVKACMKKGVSALEEAQRPTQRRYKKSLDAIIFDF